MVVSTLFDVDLDMALCLRQNHFHRQSACQGQKILGQIAAWIQQNFYLGSINNVSIAIICSGFSFYEKTSDAIESQNLIDDKIL